MRTITTSALLALALAACGPADDGQGQLVWDVQRPNGAKAVLFGTIHSLGVDAAREEYPAALDDFLSSSVLVVETDTSNVDIDEYTRHALLADDEPSLDSQLTADEWGELTAELYDVPASILRRARPWYVLQLVIARHVASKRGDNALPMDAELVVDAKARGAEVVFLESWREQLEAIAGTTDITTLKEALAIGLNKYQFQTTELEIEWRGGNAKSISQRLDAQTQAHNEVLLDARNERWRVRLEEMLKNERRDIFVAVGTAHLVYGNKRLPQLLRRSGLAVSRRPSRE